MVALALAASALSDHVASEARARTLDSAPTTTVTVCAGESLWSIAGRHGVEGVPTQDVVSWIEARNSIEGGRIDPGQRIVVSFAGVLRFLTVAFPLFCPRPDLYVL